jgi:hypothetical protein
VPHFTIFEGEQAVRMKNARLEVENRKLKAENERLRAKCGEVAVAEVIAEQEAAAARLGGGEVQAMGMEGQKVTIGRLPTAGGPVALNPLVARARPGLAQKQAQSVAAVTQPDDLPASTQEAEEALPSQRFSLLEMK